MTRAVPDDPISAVEAELLQQKAATLARISGTLTTLVEDLHRRRVALETLPGAARPEALAGYAAVRAKAERYLWYLMVQREALGLYRHEGLNELYPIPPEPRQD